MTFDRDGVAIITGACGGIGAEVAEMLAAQGLSLALLDKQSGEVEERVAALKQHHSQPIVGLAVDVADAAQVEDGVSSIIDQLGPVGYLVNGAGVLHHGTVADTNIQAWERTFAVNATGVFNVSRAVSNHMMQQGKGRIVTIASNAARVPRATMAAYCASKAAAQAFTYALGLEVAPYGIRCNVVAPGSTDTPMLRGMWHSDDDRQHTLEGNPAQFRIGIPLRKVATPGEIAAAVCFYLSDESGQTTLSTLLVDGGAALGSC
ncbi:2,3-dihydro-2,3-dihydroxybenzoate dehydrogenase [Dickeya dadantii]|uniref:2,3-dihydro-2,3-dihydroxybenzoate dehydrogenase n=1 Tax=Dickeya dadantii TaxID=204038 RepID=UPI001CF589B8|nr:2,3-dihydro-2,3-dihydroxybenzoate dehydrogenase [Dickeya dadantii]MCA7014966.1 2,3-dihydro-2,3-dihydroxybenzoate dehydrogenase [Dickeya dadantii]